MKAEEVKVCGIGKADHIIWRARRRQRAAIKVGWKKAGDCGRLLVADFCCGVSAGEHGVAVKGTGSCPCEAAAREYIHSVVVCVRPDPPLRIIGEVRAEVELVEVIGAGGIGGGGAGHALCRMGGRAVILQLGHEPASGQMVIKDYRITTVGIGRCSSAELTESAEVGPNL